MKVRVALDILHDQGFALLKKKQIAVLCNQASVDTHFRHILELLLPHKNRGDFTIRAVFGPQHGLWGHTQDNMIGWEGYQDAETGLTIYSLYGRHRQPTPEMLRDIDLFLVDLPDVGARYYTFIWTMALCMEACQEQGISMMVLDRPNPISGAVVEGTVLSREFSSFVGLFPLPQRHGMTIGEIAHYLQKQYFPQLSLQVIKMDRWQRGMFFPETGLSWIMPSPNMPVWETALVYPGMCLFEATNLSEGRGTTRPFEIFGAPFINGRQLCRQLNQLHLPGVYFRAIQFQPTFQKYQGEVCEGGFIHITERERFKPVLTTMAILQEVIRQYPGDFRWKQPPYEYEYHKLPIDILAGNSWLREAIENLTPLEAIEERMQQETAEFEEIRRQYLLY